MKTTLIKLFCLTLLSLAISNCSDDDNNELGTKEYEVISPENPEQKGERLFGINISESTYGFSASFDKATESGLEIVEINMPWNLIETEKGKYTDPNGTFAATAFYAANKIKVGLSLAVINTVAWEVPDYLKDINVNSPEFISAFNSMVDWVLDAFPDEVEIRYISIGNEVDLVLSTDGEWEAYTDFFKQASTHIKTNYGNIDVGVKTTIMGGLYGTEKTKIQLINQHSDVIMLNYYPQDQQFKVMAPDIVDAHFGDIVTWFPNKEIFLTEVGYQSGDNYCESSEVKQALFYHNMFNTWDKYKGKIKMTIIDWLYEQSPETIEAWKGYYGDSPALVEYLSTLGLLNYDGTEKAAWKQVTTETKARGW